MAKLGVIDQADNSFQPNGAFSDFGMTVFVAVRALGYR